MKCPRCKGTGEVLTATGKAPCPKCCKPIILDEQTNEEWFCKLNTKEKAEVFFMLAKDNFKLLKTMYYGIANDDQDAFAMWLKGKYDDCKKQKIINDNKTIINCDSIEEAMRVYFGIPASQEEIEAECEGYSMLETFELMWEDES